GRRGDLDVLLTHSPDDEAAFMATGHGAMRLPVMYNEFVLVGPVADPAGAASEPDAATALRAIRAARATFVSRGDDSGTHQKERALWTASGAAPDWPGYIAAATSMADVLRLTSERGAYTL